MKAAAILSRRQFFCQGKRSVRLVGFSTVFPGSGFGFGFFFRLGQGFLRELDLGVFRSLDRFGFS